MKITLPIPATDLNAYINIERRNRYAGAGIKRRETEAAARAIKKEMDAGIQFTWPAKLKFTWHLHNRRKDPDNISFMKKYVLDGMQKCDFIPNDNLKHITGFIDEFVVDKQDIVEVEEVHDSPEGVDV